MSGRFRFTFPILVLATLSAVLVAQEHEGRIGFPCSSSDPALARLAAVSGTDLVLHGTVTGNIHANGDVELKDGSRVEGDVSASGRIRGTRQGTVDGNSLEGADSVTIPPLDLSTLRAIADRVFESDTILDEEVIEDVVFVNGILRVRSRGLRGSGTLIATRDLRIDALESVTDPPHGADSRLCLIALDDIRVGKGPRALEAALVSGRDIQIEKDVEIRGALLAARRVQVDKGAHVESTATDPVPPLITFLSPAPQSTVTTRARPEIVVVYSDSQSGLDLTTFELAADGHDVTASCDVAASSAACRPLLITGGHTVRASIRDLEGNFGSAELHFELVVDPDPPIVRIESPADGSLSNSPLVLVTGTTSDVSRLDRVAVNGVAAVIGQGTFRAGIVLSEGVRTIEVAATDAAGNVGVASSGVVVDTEPPDLVVTAPSSGTIVHEARIRVSGHTSDAQGIAAVEIDGVAANVIDGAFDEVVSLADGENTISVRAVDRAGNGRRQHVSIERFALPAVKITEPDPLTTTSVTRIDVRGQFSGDVTAVQVGDAEVTLSGNTFDARGVSLHEGTNTLTVLAVADNGRVAVSTVTVVRDTTPPRVLVENPVNGAVVHSTPIVVRGEVRDPIPGAVSRNDPTVTVAGIPATVRHGAFLVDEVDLVPGDNLLTVRASDEAGNVAQTSLALYFEPPAGRHLRVVSGHRQSGAIGSRLPLPLVVSARAEAGDPLAGIPILFKVRAGGGRLEDGRRRIAAVTDAEGLARASWTLGALAGAQAVEGSAVGFAGPAQFVASALAGGPAHVITDSGNGQTGILGQPLPEPLVAVVTDAGFNRLPGVPVTFRVAEGEGLLSNGQPEATVFSDSQGRVSEVLTLGPGEGVANNVVEVRLDGTPESSFATFSASARAAGDPADTHVTGLVLDNTDRPVPGAQIRISGTGLVTESDATGFFRLDSVPIGALDLVVDGSTTSRPGVWPRLEFRMFAIAGHDNRLDRPVYLLPLEVGAGLFVDETTGGTLRLEDVPGFALEIAPGSVTFPDGSRSGAVSVTQVHTDRVPMTPSFGQQPRLIVTVQPTGALFDPPARLVLPNVDGLEPGASTELYSFDHDLGRFTAIGRGTVSGNGTVVASNPGVGIVKAGWHCGGNPQATTGAPHNCADCWKCTGSICEVDESQNGRPCRPPKSLLLKQEDDECLIKRECQDGNCTPERVVVRGVDGPCVAAIGEPVTFTVDSNLPDRVKWSALGGSPAEGRGRTFTVTFESDSLFESVRAFCEPSSDSKVIELRRPCGDTEPGLDIQREDGTHDATLFAGEVRGTYPRVSYDVCAEDGKHCFALATMTARLIVSVATEEQENRINIENASDPDVTKRNCEEIIKELTPPLAGANFGPMSSKYWSRPITQAHEQFHVDDVTDRVYKKTLESFHTKLKDFCTDCPRQIPVEELSAVLNKTFEEFLGAYNLDREVRAYGLSNKLYRQLIEDIRQRARDEKWSRACR